MGGGGEGVMVDTYSDETKYTDAEMFEWKVED